MVKGPINKVKIFTDSNIITSIYSKTDEVDYLYPQGIKSQLRIGDSKLDRLLSMYSFSNPIITNYYRSYLKLQNVINNVSSLAGILLMIFRIVGNLI